MQNWYNLHGVMDMVNFCIPGHIFHIDNTPGFSFAPVPKLACHNPYLGCSVVPCGDVSI